MCVFHQSRQQSLFNVLAAYGMMNTEVGYCQGMSQIAAIFLMYMDEEDAFWCMHALLTNRKYTMHGKGRGGGLAELNDFKRILRARLPKAAALPEPLREGFAEIPAQGQEAPGLWGLGGEKPRRSHLRTTRASPRST
jgi:hypothetical protein